MKVVEVDNRPSHIREESDRLRDAPALTRAPAVSIEEAVACLDDRRRIWERGFTAGLAAGYQGACLEFARGTRELVPADEEITAPYPIVEAD